MGPGSGRSLGTQPPSAMSRAAGPAGWGRTQKLNLTEPLSFREGSSLLDKGICNAKQSSSSQKRAVTQRGLGRPKSSHHPPARPGVPGAGPSQEPGSAREPVAGPGSKSYDSPSGQLGARRPGTLLPFSALRGQTPLGSSYKSAEWAYCGLCARPHEGAETTDPQVSGWSPADGCPAPFQLPQASDLSDHSVLPLCKPAPDSHNLQDSLDPKRHFHTRQVTRSGSLSPFPAGIPAPAPTLTTS